MNENIVNNYIVMLNGVRHLALAHQSVVSVALDPWGGEALTEEAAKAFLSGDGRTLLSIGRMAPGKLCYCGVDMGRPSILATFSDPEQCVSFLVKVEERDERDMMSCVHACMIIAAAVWPEFDAAIVADGAEAMFHDALYDAVKTDADAQNAPTPPAEA